VATRRLALIAVASLAVAACGATPRADSEVALGSGTVGETDWSVTAYQSADYGRCVQVHFEAGDPGAVCEGTSESLEMSLMDDPAGQGSVVVIDVGDGGWTDGVVTLDDGSKHPVTAETSGWGRFLVFGVPSPRTAELIEMHNAVSGRTELRQLR
jgi:hypothetical protein